MTTTPGKPDRQLAAIREFREQVAASVLPLDLPSTAAAKENRAALLRQLDDYVIPRLSSIDAPILAVIGGSTGAGKSTLVNSLLKREVSRAGVIRPTTTSPVLIHHPADAHWFTDQRVLPELARVTGDAAAADSEGTVRLVTSDDLPAGMALLDAPDIDSVVAANRGLSRQLLAASDLWLFVTTAARYADAVPWDLLRQASDRGTAVAIVLNRVPPEVMGEVRPHLVEMLRDQGLGTAPVFPIPETTLTDAGLIPEADIARLRSWLVDLAQDASAREVVVRQTLSGALASLDTRSEELISASRAQLRVTADLVDAADRSYAAALRRIEEGMSDGALLRGEVLARWQDFVGTGEFFKKVESGVSRLRDRLTGALTGKASQPADVGEALQVGVAQLIEANADAAAAEVARAWRALPAGSELIAAQPGLAASDKDLSTRVDAAVRAWQGEVLDVVRSEGQDRRTNARVAAYGVNGIGLFLMLVAFAHTGGLMGAEVGIAGGTAVLAQRVLEAIFGDQAVRTMAAKARSALLEHTERLIGEERDRYLDAVGAKTIPTEQTDRLSRALDAVQAAS
ncbi:dynamin family protein [Nostocoides veronense]|uniref:Dynamin family protein n=1 Tax=Nostocoides veronense TaxID=330836 RepID=A0ABN2M5I6_9MICO